MSTQTAAAPEPAAKPKNKGGRPKGSRTLKLAPPARQRELADIARSHTEVAIRTLVTLCKNSPSGAVRVMAANALLDRGYGKPKQDVTIKGEIGIQLQIEQVADLSDEELMTLRSIAAKQAKVIDHQS